eukprot:TRINITY_DN14885_c0_g1_i3.p1 TRINITY_DN14885_c0_g1~~TRINITY_DN14885_c0_g1_i3.p1  ORF type:complete len:618 (-),score=68.68 TRINITY_DN14885_c0_g1_i3:79-1932(-)
MDDFAWYPFLGYTLAVAVLLVNVLNGQLCICLRQGIYFILGTFQGTASSSRMEEVMLEMKLSNATFAIDAIYRANLLGLLVAVLLAFILDDGYSLSLPIYVTLAMHSILTPFASGMLKLTHGKLNVVVTLCYALITLNIVFMPSDAFFTVLGFRTVIRLTLSLLAMDRRITVHFNSALTCVQLWRYDAVQVALRERTPPYRFYCPELLSLLLIVWVCTIFETSLRMRAEAICDVEDSKEAVENSLLASRKMLAVLCDADVLLDSDYRIVGASSKLGHLLMTQFGQSGLHGRSFVDFLANTDHDRFIDFIGSFSSTSEGSEAENTSSLVPSSLHICLNSTSNLKVKAELFHVPVKPVGGERVQHLIGIKEQDPWQADADRGKVHGGEDIVPPLPDIKFRSPSSASSSGSGSSSKARRKKSRNFAASGLAKVSFIVDAGQPAHPMHSITFPFDSTRSAPLSKFLAGRSADVFQAWLSISAAKLHMGQKTDALDCEHLEIYLMDGHVFRAGYVDLHLVRQQDHGEAQLEDELDIHHGHSEDMSPAQMEKEQLGAHVVQTEKKQYAHTNQLGDKLDTVLDNADEELHMYGAHSEDKFDMPAFLVRIDFNRHRCFSSVPCRE